MHPGGIQQSWHGMNQPDNTSGFDPLPFMVPVCPQYLETMTAPESEGTPESEEDKALKVKAVAVLEEWLQTPRATSLSAPDGSVPIQDALSVCGELKELSGNSVCKQYRMHVQYQIYQM